MKKRVDFIEELKKKNDISKALSTMEMAELCCVSSTTIIKWIKEGKINCIRTIGGHRRIPISELDKILKEMKCNTIENEFENLNSIPKRPFLDILEDRLKQNKDNKDNNSNIKPKIDKISLNYKTKDSNINTFRNSETDSKYPINKFIKKKTKKD